MKNLTLGEKIRKFRNRAGLSQLDLECKIGAASGSVSRIESGKINPTKETVQRIIDVLDLSPIEIASLFNIEPNNIASLISVAKHINDSFQVDEILQQSVNKIANELNLLGAGIFLTDGDTLCSKTLTQKWFTEAYRKLLSKPYEMHRISLSDHGDNYIVRCINERKAYYTEIFYDATKHAYTKLVTELLSKLIGFKCGIAVPLEYCGEVIGAVFYAKDYIDDFSLEMPILKAFNEHIAVTIANAQKYEKLETEIKKLKSMKQEERAS